MKRSLALVVVCALSASSAAFADPLLPASTVASDDCNTVVESSALTLPGASAGIPVATVGHGLRNVYVNKTDPNSGKDAGYCATLMVSDPTSYNATLSDSTGAAERKAIAGMSAAALRIDIRLAEILPVMVKTDFQTALNANFTASVVTASTPLQAFLNAAYGSSTIQRLLPIKGGSSIIIAWNETGNQLFYQQANGSIVTIPADATALDQVLAIWLGDTSYDVGLDALKKQLLAPPAPAAN